MPLYEHVFLARQDLAQAQVDALAQTATEIIENNGGKVVKIQNTTHLEQLRAGLKEWQAARVRGDRHFTLGRYNGGTLSLYLDLLDAAPVTEQDAQKPVLLGSQIRLDAPERRYNWSNLTGQISTRLPSGVYTVVGISNGNFMLQGYGRRGWVDGNRVKSGLV